MTSDFRRLDLRSVPVTIILDAMTIRGTIHVDPTSNRFTDAWDNLMRDRRRFVAVTEAEIVPRDGEPTKAAFLSVDKEQVRAIYPTDAGEGEWS